MNKPKLRFKGFYNDWKEGKLEDFCIINPNSSSLPDTFYYIDLECVENGRIVSDLNAIDKVSAPSRAQRVLVVNDLLYQMVRPYQRNNFLFIQEKELPTVASTGYAQIRTKDNDIRFLYQKLHTDSFVKCAMQRSTGTGYPAINSTDLATINIKLPEIDEQKKIAEFLSKVDEVIAEREEEVKDLEKQKKGLMQKIFSQQLRFTDSNNNPYPDWEEKKIGDICKTFSGGTPSITQSIYYNGDIPFIKSGEIHSSSTEMTITEAGLNNSSAKLVNKGDLLLALYGATSGEVDISKIDGAINQAILCIRSDKLNLCYLKNVLTYEKEKILCKYLQGGQGNLSAEIIKALKFKFPCLEEQQKIANVLSKLDELIEEKKALLSDWQSFKKGLLQQMFV